MTEKNGRNGRNSKNTRRTTERSTPRNTNRKKTKRRRGKHSKKDEINKFRLAILVLGVVAALFVGKFVITKAFNFGTQIWPNVVYLKNTFLSNPDDNKNIDNREQFDLEDENKEKLSRKNNIFIDVGKGGNDVGYTTEGGASEKEINLKVASNVAKRLSRYDDVNVILSREEDIFLSSADRIALADSAKADLFVSINLASEASGNAEGIETIYGKNADPKSIDFASIMQTSISAHVDAKNRGISSYDMSVLRDSEIPAIYVQYGFLSNEKEAKKLTSQKYQDQLAEGLAQGILGYIDAKK